jgi:hypothetical protein
MSMDKLRIRHASFLALASCWLAFIAAHDARAYTVDPGDPLPPKLSDQFQKNATAMSAVHLEFTMSLSGTDVPPQYGGPSKYSASFDGGHYYLHREFLIRYQRIERELYEESFDGKIFYYGTPPRKNGAGTDIAPVLDKYLLEDRTDPDRDSPRIDIPYLMAAGYYFASSVADLEKPSIKSLVLHDLSIGDKARVEQETDLTRVTVVIPDPILEAVRRINLTEYRKAWEQGRNTREQVSNAVETMARMQRMEPKRTVTLLLDPKYGYGVVERVDSTLAGQRIVRVVADRWKYYEDARIWLPGRCTEDCYSIPPSLSKIYDHPIIIQTLQLDRVEFGPQRNVKFALDYSTPGSIIRDRTSAEARKMPRHVATYVVSADKKELRRAGDAALEEIKHDWLSRFVIVNVGVVGVIALVVMIYLNRSRIGRRMT